MKIYLKIDNRESAVYNNILERDLDVYKDKIDINKQQLDIGDILISFYTDNNKIEYIFERKTINDLLSSVNDGRYKEQKKRLLSGDYDKITYIIEGNDNIIASKNNKQNLLNGIYTHSIYRDNIHLVFTKDIIETVSYILILSSKIIENPSKFIKNTNNDYLDELKLKSKKISNITPSICYIMQLSQIPYISNSIAKKIIEKYPTFKDLIHELDKTEDKISLLCNIDKIGKEKAKNILEYLSYI